MHPLADLHLPSALFAAVWTTPFPFIVFNDCGYSIERGEFCQAEIRPFLEGDNGTTR